MFTYIMKFLTDGSSRIRRLASIILWHGHCRLELDMNVERSRELLKTPLIFTATKITLDKYFALIQLLIIWMVTWLITSLPAVEFAARWYVEICSAVSSLHTGALSSDILSPRWCHAWERPGDDITYEWNVKRRAPRRFIDFIFEAAHYGGLAMPRRPLDIDDFPQ